ncbi:MAG: stage II sporulation protein M [Candidatus Bathyarchaeota archaeon]
MSSVKSYISKIMYVLKSIFQRNNLIIKTTTITFFIFLIISIIISVIIFSLSPELAEGLNSLMDSLFNFENAPEPSTGNFYLFIFLNNTGHFWNPIRMLVWIPLLGAFLLGFEILLNSGLIGLVSVIAGIEQGIAYPIIGLIPHGIIEIPAFLLQIICIIKWQVTIFEVINSKIRHEELEKEKTIQDLKDTIILATISIILFLIAAAIETYITPYLLGI